MHPSTKNSKILVEQNTAFRRRRRLLTLFGIMFYKFNGDMPRNPSNYSTIQKCVGSLTHSCIYLDYNQLHYLINWEY